MSKEIREVYQVLNMLICGVNEDSTKDPHEYIYNSLSHPPLKVVDKRGTDDEHKWIVECPNCGEEIIYGTQTAMVHGYTYCLSDGCKDNLLRRLEQIRSENAD